MNQQQQANLIKIAAVVTAAPRWTGALLAAEGFTMPQSWQSWWLPVSALLSAGMALVEGLAFAYVFNAWRTQKDKKANKLLWLAILSAVVFVFVLAPFIAAQVRQVALDVILGAGWGLWVWSASVAASTIVIVASVGYAQKQKDERKSTAQAPAQPAPSPTTTISDNGHERSFAEFERAVIAGNLSLPGLTGDEIAVWSGRSASTGRRWKRRLEQVEMSGQ